MPSLKARALRWLAQREHSRAELRRKLLPHARALEQADAEGCAATGAGRDGVADPPAPTREAGPRVDALLDALERDQHLSAQRFVESRVHLRADRHGLRRIEAELAEHGLALDAAQRAALRATELERARATWARRFGRAPADAAEAARQARFLLARGFDPDVVRTVLRQAGDATTDAGS